MTPGEKGQCTTGDCDEPATHLVTCEGEGWHPYCDDCTDVLVRQAHERARPIVGTSFLLRARREGIHIRCSIFAGPDSDHRVYCGNVMFRPEEWDDLQAVLLGHADMEER